MGSKQRQGAHRRTPRPGATCPGPITVRLSSVLRQKAQHQAVEGLGVLPLHPMAAAVEDNGARIGDEAKELQARLQAELEAAQEDIEKVLSEAGA